MAGKIFPKAGQEVLQRLRRFFQKQGRKHCKDRKDFSKSRTEWAAGTKADSAAWFLKELVKGEALRAGSRACRQESVLWTNGVYKIDVSSFIRKGRS